MDRQPDEGNEEVLPGLDPSVGKRVVSQEAETVNVRKMFHRGTVREFVFHSDEPPELWGEDEHPRPLDYLLASVGF